MKLQRILATSLCAGVLFATGSSARQTGTGAGAPMGGSGLGTFTLPATFWTGGPSLFGASDADLFDRKGAAGLRLDALLGPAYGFFYPPFPGPVFTSYFYGDIEMVRGGGRVVASVFGWWGLNVETGDGFVDAQIYPAGTAGLAFFGQAPPPIGDVSGDFQFTAGEIAAQELSTDLAIRWSLR